MSMITELIDKLRGQASVLADNSNDSEDHVRNLILKSLTNSLLEAADTIQFLSDSQPKPSEDCISRQDVINSIANTNFWLSADNWQELMKAIDSVPSIQPEQRWIPCKDRLPEKHGKYICTIDVYDRDKIVDFVTYDPNLGWYVHNVTAWMPLPESFKAESER